MSRLFLEMLNIRGDPYLSPPPSVPLLLSFAVLDRRREIVILSVILPINQHESPTIMLFELK